MQQSDLDVLEKLLARVRRRLFARTAGFWCVRAALWVLPVAAMVTAAAGRWGPAWSPWLVAVAGLAAVSVFCLLKAWLSLGEEVHAALVLDDRADLKDRISSACEFLKEGHLN